MRGESITRVRVRYTTYTAVLDQYANTRIIQSSERHRERAPAQHRTQNHPSWATQASHASGQSRKHHMLRASEMGDVRIYTEPSPEPMRESELSEPSSDAASDARKSASNISSRSMAGMGRARRIAHLATHCLIATCRVLNHCGAHLLYGTAANGVG